MKDGVRVLLLGVFLLVLTCTVVWAQATAQMGGTVRDASGAVLPGVDITVMQTATGVVRTTVTNETGLYTLPSLPLGPYRLEAALPGFRTFVRTGIVLEVNSNATVNVVLEVGQVNETVEVQANAALVETRNTSIGQTIDNVRILELPLDGRNVESLITLTAGTVQTETLSNRGWAGQPVLSVAGGVGFGVKYTLDGARHKSAHDGTPRPYPFPDALQEFRVETSATSAQNESGTSVTSVTKSGTNELHGSGFYFLRHDVFNAREFFAVKDSSFRRYQVGATIGGPIQRDRLFFFGGYQGTFRRQDPANIIDTVPTAAMLAGDFTAFASPACNAGRQITLKAPFVNNRVNPSLFSPAALNLAKRLPRSDHPCGEITYGQETSQNEGQFLGRIDYQASASHSLFGRYFATSLTAPKPAAKDGNILTMVNNLGLDNLAQSFALGSTYLIGPNTVQSFRLSANRHVIVVVGPDFFSAPDLGVKMFSFTPKYMGLSVTGAFALGGPGGQGVITTRTYVNDFEAVEDVSFLRGAHQVSVGGNLAYATTYRISGVRQGGQFIFDGSQTGTGLADVLLGKTSRFWLQGPVLLDISQWYPGAYVHDSWKATPNLTLNAGVRWDPFVPQVMRNGAIYNFSPERFQQGVKSTVFPNAPAGVYYPGDPGFPGKRGVYTQWWNFAPRVGLAWDVRGDGRTSIRAGYGLSYEYNPHVWLNNAITAPPFNLSVQLPTPAGGFDDPWRDFPGGDPFPLSIDKDSKFPVLGGYAAIPFDNKPTNVQSWNLSLQREIVPGWITSATYIGNQITHLWVAVPLNPAVSVPGASTTRNIDQRRRFILENPQEGQFYAAVNEFRSDGTGSYHAMMLSAERRAARGLNFSGNYTWSHCISDTINQGGTSTNQISNSLQDANDRRWQRGNCESDRRHIFNLTAVAEMPQFANSALRRLASGWRLSGIYRRSSGRFLNIVTGEDRMLNGIGNQRPNQLLDEVYGDRSARPMAFYLNPSAFARPALGTLGNVGQNSVEGPGTWSFDMALSRIVQIREGRRLEFRAEGYNVTNSFRPGNPIADLRNRNFGQIRTALSPRIMQFALKYIF